jgi:hypothetical protein
MSDRLRYVVQTTRLGLIPVRETIEAVLERYPVPVAVLTHYFGEFRPFYQREGVSYRATWRGKPLEGRSDLGDVDEARARFEAALAALLADAPPEP